MTFSVFSWFSHRFFDNGAWGAIHLKIGFGHAFSWIAMMIVTDGRFPDRITLLLVGAFFAL